MGFGIYLITANHFFPCILLLRLGEKSLGMGISFSLLLNQIWRNQKLKKMRKKKYRLRKNYFNIKSGKIHLNIPITDDKLEYGDTINISSNHLNAILVWIKSPDGACTPNTDPIDSLKEKITFQYLKLDESRLKDDPVLIVAVFNNNELLQTDLDYFKKIIQDSDDVTEAILEIRKGNLCNTSITPFRPREQDGDVIGGNG